MAKVISLGSNKTVQPQIANTAVDGVEIRNRDHYNYSCVIIVFWLVEILIEVERICVNY